MLIVKKASIRLFRPCPAACLTNSSKALTGSKKSTSMGKLFARTNLLTRLIILILAATLPGVAVIAYMQYNLRSDGERRIADEALRHAELLNADIANVVEGARQLSLAITHFAAVRDGDLARVAKLAELRSDLPSYAALSVVTAEGRVICSTGGSLGMLIGADLLNLDKVRGLGAPVASIGGAGTFDGNFLTGVLAVLLVSIFSPPDGQDDLVRIRETQARA
jgi:Protein of unknown function (DUF1614)